MVSERQLSGPRLQDEPLATWLEVYDVATPEDYVQAAFRALHSAVACDFVSAVHRQPAQGYCRARDSLGRVWNEAFAQQQADLVTAGMEAIPLERISLFPDPTVMSTDAGSSLAECRREIKTIMAFEHAATLVIGLRGHGFSLAFSLHRREGGGDFAPAEREILAVARGYLERAWTRLHERLMTRTVMHGISFSLRHYSRGVMILNFELEILWANRAARIALPAWEDPRRAAEKPGREPGRVPGPILSACQRLVGAWRERSLPAAWPKACCVAHPAAPTSRATVRLVGGRSPHLPLPNILVEFQPADAPVESAPRSGGSFRDALTASEQEIVGLVCEGLTNQEIADRLAKSVAAVKFHLYHIFKKAQVRSRTQLSVLIGRLRF